MKSLIQFGILLLSISLSQAQDTTIALRDFQSVMPARSAPTDGKVFIDFVGSGDIQKSISEGKEINANTGMGIIFENYERKRLAAHLQLTTLSQEHGKVTTAASRMIEGKYAVGDRVRILEHHSCLTMANFDRYYVVREEEVVEEWKIWRGRV